MDKTWLSRLNLEKPHTILIKEVKKLKRIGYLWEPFISNENILKAIKEVNKTHRTSHEKPNKTVIWVEKNLEECIIKLRKLVENDFQPSPTKEKRIYDKSAQKYRIIHEPPLWPDQYIHHMLIQVLEPIMMRGMDYWCCASIRGRGTQRGIKGIKKWIKNTDNTRFAAELDIYHFYESLKPRIVMKRMKKLIKDKRILAFIKILISKGITIGAYFSQWFANTTLQELDNFIRQKLKIHYYIRYMDNLTLFNSNKKYLHYCVSQIKSKLSSYKLSLKTNWQVFPTNKRLICALGYRFGKNFLLLRKRSLFKLKRHLRTVIKKKNFHKRIGFRFAAGLIARIGQLKWCNHRSISKRYIPSWINGMMKQIVSNSRRRLNVRIQF